MICAYLEYDHVQDADQTCRSVKQMQTRASRRDAPRRMWDTRCHQSGEHGAVRRIAVVHSILEALLQSHRRRGFPQDVVFGVFVGSLSTQQPPNSWFGVHPAAANSLSKVGAAMWTVSTIMRVSPRQGAAERAGCQDAVTLWRQLGCTCGFGRLACVCSAARSLRLCTLGPVEVPTAALTWKQFQRNHNVAYPSPQ